jgi:hypothetical protein
VYMCMYVCMYITSVCATPHMPRCSLPPVTTKPKAKETFRTAAILFLCIPEDSYLTKLTHGAVCLFELSSSLILIPLFRPFVTSFDKSGRDDESGKSVSPPCRYFADHCQLS